jgi:hypothetical protein
LWALTIHPLPAAMCWMTLARVPEEGARRGACTPASASNSGLLSNGAKTATKTATNAH